VEIFNLFVFRLLLVLGGGVGLLVTTPETPRLINLTRKATRRTLFFKILGKKNVFPPKKK